MNGCASRCPWAGIWSIVIVLFGGGTAFFPALLAVVSASLSWNLALLFVAFYINEVPVTVCAAWECVTVCGAAYCAGTMWVGHK